MAQANAIASRTARWLPAPIDQQFVPPRGAPSLERQPWRAFRSSLAIQFHSPRRSDFTTLDPSTKVELGAALQAVELTRNLHAKLKCSLFDIIYTARRLDAYARMGVFAGKADNEIRAAVRALALAAGPLSAHREEVLDVLRDLDACEAHLNLLVHGLIHVGETRAGTIRFEFLLQRKRRKLTVPEVQIECAACWRVLNAAIETLIIANRDLDVN